MELAAFNIEITDLKNNAYDQASVFNQIKTLNALQGI